MASTPTTPAVSPERIFDLLGAYRRTAALKAAIELDLFSAIAGGATTAAAIAQKLGTPERGVRILCDFLTIEGLLSKQGSCYGLEPDVALFLDRSSPAYVGGVSEFLNSHEQMRASLEGVADAVRRGGAQPSEPIPDYPGWIQFARAMGPYTGAQAEMLVDIAGEVHGRVLDIAASHGLFGIAFARHSPTCEVVALDSKPVLDVVARENAARAGVETRYHLLPGDAFKTPLGEGYELVLLTNILHHFDRATIVALLRRVRAALAPGGRALTLDFVPNADRVSPPFAAAFSLTMLANTPHGDAYTLAEYETMFAEAGFSGLAAHPLPTPQTVLLARTD